MLKLDSHDDFHQEVETFCNLPFSKVILTSHAEVSMCCHQNVMLGQLTEETGILDIWRGAFAQKVREETLKGALHPVCTSWNSCPFIVKERTKYKMKFYRRFAYPMIMEICLPDTHCNVGGENPTPDNPACIMCKRNWIKPHQPDMTDFLCKKAKPVMPYIRELMVLGIAEPFWKDALFKIYEQVEFHRYKHRVKFHTNTNVICLNERTSRRFFEETEWSDLAFSFDAATPETFRKIRRMNVFDTVVKNAKSYLKMRNEYGGRDHHKVHIWNNINLLNIDEMTQMVEMASELGVDYMVMLPTYDQQGFVKLGEMMLCQKNVGLFKRASEKAMERAKQLGLNLHYVKRFDVAPDEVAQPEPELIQIDLKP